MKKDVPNNTSLCYTRATGGGASLGEIQALDLDAWGAAELKSVGTIDEIIARRNTLLVQWNGLC